MTDAAPQQFSIPFRECALRAVVLTPQRPIAYWLDQLNGLVQDSQDTFVGSAVLLDLAVLQPNKVELKALLVDLRKRNFRVMAVEGVDPASLGPGMPPLLSAGSQTEVAEAVPASHPVGEGSCPSGAGAGHRGRGPIGPVDRLSRR